MKQLSNGGGSKEAREVVSISEHANILLQFSLLAYCVYCTLCVVWAKQSQFSSTAITISGRKGKKR